MKQVSANTMWSITCGVSSVHISGWNWCLQCIHVRGMIRLSSYSSDLGSDLESDLGFTRSTSRHRDEVRRSLSNSFSGEAILYSLYIRIDVQSPTSLIIFRSVFRLTWLTTFRSYYCLQTSNISKYFLERLYPIHHKGSTPLWIQQVAPTKIFNVMRVDKNLTCLWTTQEEIQIISTDMTDWLWHTGIKSLFL